MCTLTRISLLLNRKDGVSVLYGTDLDEFQHHLVREFDAAAGELESVALEHDEAAVCKVGNLFRKYLLIHGRQLDALGFS